MLRIKNAEEIREYWANMIEDESLVLIMVRHAEKVAGGSGRCGLSPRGFEQVHAYAALIESQLGTLWDAVDVSLLSSDTERNRNTLWELLPRSLRERVSIETPKELDLPFLGPNEEDLATVRELAAELGVEPKEVFSRLEDYGRPRLGETPTQSSDRIRAYLADHIDEELGQEVLVYCINSPTGNEAVGVEGALAELEVLFLGYNAEIDRFIRLGRIAPEWEEVAD